MHELFQQYISEASNDFDYNMMKIQAVSDANARQYEINRKSAELKVMNENGTDDDLNMLYEAASQLNDETIAVINEKASETVSKYFAKIKDKVSSAMSRTKTDETMVEVEKKVKLFPMIGKKKILVEDYKSVEKVAGEAHKSLKVLKAKAIAGQEITSDQIQEVMTKFENDEADCMGVAKAKPVTTNAAVTLARNLSKSASNVVDNIESDCKKFLSNMEKVPSSVSTQLSSAYSRVSKTLANAYVEITTDIIGNVKNAIKGAPTNAEMKESTDTDGVTSQADMKELDNAAKEAEKAAANSTTTTEEGEDMGIPSTDAVDPITAVDNVDPFDAVIKSLEDEPTGNECTESTDNSTYNALLQEIMSASDPVEKEKHEHVDDKPANSTLVQDLFKQVMAEARGENPEPKPADIHAFEATEESVFEQLKAEIANLI